MHYHNKDWETQIKEIDYAFAQDKERQDVGGRSALTASKKWVTKVGVEWRRKKNS